MKCEFCRQDLLKNKDAMGNPISIPRIGIVHRICAEKEKCAFCDTEVFLNNETKGEAISVRNVGTCHALCAEKDLISKKVFGSRTHLADISLCELYELKELVQLEINHQEEVNMEPELF